MYTRFFGLNEKPFTITPDPRYLFMSERHGEGLAHLVYGVTESGGFIQLTGEVGTGKTTLVRTLLGQIPAEVDIALILNPQLTAVEFLASICEELGIPLPAEKNSSKALVDALNRHLLEAHSRGRRTILLIDEAQNLAGDVLEQLRLLTNLETSKQKLLQIILIAQPELREKLAQNNMRQLAQRVTGRYHLEPLSREETGAYIDHRLRVAGALTEVFSSHAKGEIFQLSGGVPRVINVICDRALLGAFSRETRKIDSSLVRKAAAEVSGQKLTPKLLKWALPVVALGVTVYLASLFWSQPEDIDPAAQAASGGVTAAEPEASSPVTAVEPAPNPPDATSADIEALLEEHEASAGIADLLSIWNIAYDAAAGPACAQVESQGLSCYYQRGSWSGIRQLDRPVVLTLTGSNGTSYQTALTGLRTDAAELYIGESRHWFPIDAVAEMWFGQFMLIWRPPNGKIEAIMPGSQNENVRWLRKSLAALDTNYKPQSPDSDLFDAELEQQLVSFQRRHRLEADGLAGQKTQIIINTMLADDGSPRLSDSSPQQQDTGN
jgi:general secretion pathway protein A